MMYFCLGSQNERFISNSFCLLRVATVTFSLIFRLQYPGGIDWIVRLPPSTTTPLRGVIKQHLSPILGRFNKGIIRVKTSGTCSRNLYKRRLPSYLLAEWLLFEVERHLLRVYKLPEGLVGHQGLINAFGPFVYAERPATNRREGDFSFKDELDAIIFRKNNETLVHHIRLVLHSFALLNDTKEK